MAAVRQSSPLLPLSALVPVLGTEYPDCGEGDRTERARCVLEEAWRRGASATGLVPRSGRCGLEDDDGCTKELPESEHPQGRTGGLRHLRGTVSACRPLPPPIRLHPLHRNAWVAAVDDK